MFDFLRSNEKNSSSGHDARIELCNEEQWPGLLDESYKKPVYIFKHSSRCGVSSMVRSRFEKQILGRGGNYYHLHIQTCRPLSNRLAQELEIPHESPQLIVLKEGSVIAQASHHAVLDILPEL